MQHGDSGRICRITRDGAQDVAAAAEELAAGEREARLGGEMGNQVGVAVHGVEGGVIC